MVSNNRPGMQYLNEVNSKYFFANLCQHICTKWRNLKNIRGHQFRIENGTEGPYLAHTPRPRKRRKMGG